MPTDPGESDGSGADGAGPGPGSPNTGGPYCESDETTTGDPCQNTVQDSEDTCHLHGDDGEVSDNHGSGSPGHGKGGGAAPEGNKNAMTHGVHASKNDPWGTLDHLADDSPAVYAQVVRWFWDAAQRAPFPVYMGDDAPDVPDDVLNTGVDGVPGIDVARLSADAADLLLVCLDKGIAFNATADQADRGLAYEQKKATSDGVVMAVDENPVNLPKNRMRREDRAQLKDLGLREDSPDSVAAQGKQDLAAAAERIGRRKDQDQNGDGGEADA